MLIVSHSPEELQLMAELQNGHIVPGTIQVHTTYKTELVTKRGCEELEPKDYYSYQAATNVWTCMIERNE